MIYLSLRRLCSGGSLSLGAPYLSAAFSDLLKYPWKNTNTQSNAIVSNDKWSEMEAFRGGGLRRWGDGTHEIISHSTSCRPRWCFHTACLAKCRANTYRPPKNLMEPQVLGVGDYFSSLSRRLGGRDCEIWLGGIYSCWLFSFALFELFWKEMTLSLFFSFGGIVA